MIILRYPTLKRTIQTLIGQRPLPKNKLLPSFKQSYEISCLIVGKPFQTVHE